MFRRYLTPLILTCSLSATATPPGDSEPFLLVEFEGYVTGNTLTCSETGLGCPDSNHFGASWGENTMVGEPWDQVRGKFYVAYSRPEDATLEITRDHEAFDARTTVEESVNFILGDISIGGVIYNLDRDYKNGGKLSIEPVVQLDRFTMSEGTSGQYATFDLAPQSYSGHKYFTRDNGRRILMRSFHAETALSLSLRLGESPNLKRFFGPFEPNNLPGFEWYAGQPRNAGYDATLRLRDHEARRVDEFGLKHREYETLVEFAVTSLKVASLNGRPPDRKRPTPPKNFDIVK